MDSKAHISAMDKLVLLSWLATTAIISTAGYLNSSTTTPLAGGICFTIVAALLLGWPWFILLDYEEEKTYVRSSKKLVFSVISVVIAISFYDNILGAPSEGSILTMLNCVFIIWLSYAATWLV